MHHRASAGRSPVRPMSVLIVAAAATIVGCGFKIEPDPAFMATQGGEPSATSTPASEARSAREVAIDRLVEMAGSTNPQVRANAVEGLARTGARSEAVVALALRDENPGVRSVAAMVAGRARLSSLAPTLRAMGDDPSQFVQASVLCSLHRMGEAGDPTPVSRMLLESPDPRLRAHAAFVLGEMGDPSAIPMLQQAWSAPMRNTTESERRIFRLQVVEAMLKLGDWSSVDSVRSALYPARPEELEATALAVQIMGEVRDRDSIDQLIYLSDDSGNRVMPAEVRLAVAGALAKLGLNQGGFIADEYAANPSPMVRAQAAAVYGRTGKIEHLPRLGALMDDPSEVVRVAAASGVVDLLSGGASADASRP